MGYTQDGLNKAVERIQEAHENTKQQTNEDITVTADTENKKYEMLNTTLDLDVPSFFTDGLTNLFVNRTGAFDNKFFVQVGIEMLEQLRAEKILENAGLPARLQDRIPTKLPIYLTSYILMTFFTFKKVTLTGDPENAQIAMYHASGDKKGLYVFNLDSVRGTIQRMCKDYKDREVEEVLMFIEKVVDTVVVSNFDNKYKNTYVPCRNGLYNKKTKELEDFTPDVVFTSKLDVDYDENAKNPIITMPDGEKWDVVTWIRDLTYVGIDEDGNEIYDENIEKLFWEVIQAWVTQNKRGKSIWFYSRSGNNGKGTFSELLRNLAGVGNYGVLSVEDFNHNFSLGSLLGKMGNIGDENRVGAYVDDSRDYKKSITGDPLNVEQKYKNPLPLVFNGLDIQCLNDLPRVKDKTDSFTRRILLVPFTRSFTNNGERRYIKTEYMNNEDVKKYVLKTALEMDDFADFTESERTKEVMMEFKSENNPVIDFWNEFEDQFVWDLLPSKFLYDLFKSWVDETNPRGSVLSQKSFIQSLSEYLSGNDDVLFEYENKKRRTKDLMDEDEPLITDYKLVDWMVESVPTTRNTLENLRNFNRKDTYRGFLRK